MNLLSLSIAFEVEMDEGAGSRLATDGGLALHDLKVVKCWFRSFHVSLNA